MRNKIYSCLLIFVAFMCFFTVKSNATSQTFSVEGTGNRTGTTFNFEIDVSNQVFRLLNNLNYDIASDVWNYDKITVAANNDNSGFYVFVYNGDLQYRYINCDRWVCSGSDFYFLEIFYSSYDFENDFKKSFNRYRHVLSREDNNEYQASVSCENIIYSTSSIYDYNNPETVLFQPASQPVEETNQVVLAEIVENQETNKVLEEILGILPTIIIVLVSLIGLRKSFLFLKTLLKQS